MSAINRNSTKNVQLLLKCGAKVDCDYTQGMDLIANAMSYDNIGMDEIFN